MNPSWTQFLESEGAVFSENLGFHFDDQASAFSKPEGSNLIIPLGKFELLKVSGPDAQQFLQGQLTCDMADIVNGTSRLGVHCNIKGRAKFSFRALCFNNAFYLMTPPGQSEFICENLKKYILFSNVEMEPNASGLTPLGLIAGEIPAVLDGLFGKLPEATDDCQTNDRGIICRLPDTSYRWLALVPDHLATKTWNTLKQSGFTATAENHWTLSEIRAVLPQVEAATRELFIPQEINYDLINGISFTKGCYTGQEIVARLYYRGQVKKRTLPATLDLGKTDSEATTTRIPEPGTTVFVKGKEQTVGTVVQSTRSGANQATVLVSIRVDAMGAESLLVGHASGPHLTLGTTPYTLSDNQDQS